MISTFFQSYAQILFPLASRDRLAAIIQARVYQRILLRQVSLDTSLFPRNSPLQQGSHSQITHIGYFSDVNNNRKVYHHNN